MAKRGTWQNPKCENTGDCDQKKHGKDCRCSNGIHICGHDANCHKNCS